MGNTVLPGIMGRLLCLLLLLLGLAMAEEERKLKVLTVATERNAGFLRFERSCLVAGLTCTPLGMGQEWQGGDMNFPGGGWKVNLLKEAMEEIKDEKDTMVMFTDSYDVVISAGKEAILAQYDKMGADILFGAENFCWPDQSLREDYPEAKEKGMRFLNSGGFIGPATLLAKMLETGGKIENKEDDQLFYTKIFLNAELTCTPLGMGQEWQGGDMNFPGGGWKVNLLKEAMEEIKGEKDTMLMFT